LKRNPINDKDSLLFQELLCRFASLFVETNVQQTCNDNKIISREIHRVNIELFNFETNPNKQQEYLTKAFVNLEHPYSRFSANNINIGH
jgi:secreted Zn-dependent insulinase-like peptidase